MSVEINAMTALAPKVVPSPHLKPKIYAEKNPAKTPSAGKPEICAFVPIEKLNNVNSATTRKKNESATALKASPNEKLKPTTD